MKSPGIGLIEGTSSTTELERDVKRSEGHMER